MARISELAFLFPAQPKVRKPRKPAAKAIGVGKRAILSLDGNTYTIVERDTRFANAWFIADDNGKRAPYSFSRDMFKVI